MTCWPDRRLVAIGASSGGPAALAKLLPMLPRSFPAAVVVIQHVDAQLARGLATWLNQHSKLPVRVAQEHDVLESGVVLVAGSSDHLILKTASRLGYTSEPRDYVYRPSVDVFLHSACRWWMGESVGVLLTGMGRDGALGLKAMRDRGSHTIAQDEDSCAVYGMPRAAAKLDAATEILSLGAIAPRLVDIMSRDRRRVGNP